MKVRLLSVVLATASLLAGCGGGMEATIGATADVVSPQAVEPEATVLGSVSTAGLYMTPQQVRTRYGFDGLSTTTPAAQGSGQLIAIISAYNNPDLVANLAAFSAKYNLPQCTEVKTVYTMGEDYYYKANVSKPAPGAQCTIQVVNVDSFGHATKSVPQGGPATASWMMEASMDIEWAHAIAPQASILVVQAPSIFVGALGFAANYASVKAKADVVSMSWGINEASQICTRKPGTTIKYDPTCDDTAFSAKYWQSVSKVFTGDATYVAASGDRGVLQWPAISPATLAVGGTVASGAFDTGWAGSGGGVSKSFPATTQQAAHTGSQYRNVPDVAYDAATSVAVYIKPNAATGYADAACVKASGADKCGWYGGRGTSAGAPQWAGIVAITNAMRLAQGKASINYAATLYGDVAAVYGNYVSMFSDVKTGSSAYNTAKDGYDTLTGLGVPQATNLITYIASR